MYIDTHTHIYADKFLDDQNLAIQRAIDAGVEKLLLPNIDIESIDKMHQTEGNFPDHCFAMMGLHPCSVGSDYKATLEVLWNHLQSRSYIGIGEIGIDLYWDKSTLNEQKTAFQIQIEWARDLGIPFVIHSRDSLDMTISIVEEMQDGNLGGIFHCFNGTVDEGKRIADLGFLMGIGGVITYKNAGMDQVLNHLDLNDMVLETDSPYLSPVPYRGKRNESSYIPYIAERLASIVDVELETIAEVTTTNANNLFFK